MLDTDTINVLPLLLGWFAVALVFVSIALNAFEERTSAKLLSAFAVVCALCMLVVSAQNDNAAETLSAILLGVMVVAHLLNQIGVISIEKWLLKFGVGIR